MDKMLYIATTGAAENMRAQKVHANNLANVNTTAFKADLEQARSMRLLGDGYESRVFSMSERPATSFEAGSLMETGRDLDVAVSQGGWIAVLDEKGNEVYTRNGQFNTLNSGELVTSSGQTVLSVDGAPIFAPPGGRIQIGSDGTVSAVALGDPLSQPAEIDRIKLVSLDKDSAYKGLHGMMVANGNEQQPADFSIRLKSGFLESSNVNAVGELTSVIGLSKQFEIQVKMMKKAEENSKKSSEILRMS